MRCLHCGSTLSAFKKLTDSDFCSAEHRDQFYSEQQRLILSRLKQSAGRLQRFRRGPIASEATRPLAAAAPAKDEFAAPAAIAAFLLSKLEFLDACGPLLFLPELPFEGVKASLASRLDPASRRQFLCALILDLPWPRYNPGLHAFSAFESVGEALFPEFVASVALANAFPSAELVAVRRPDIAAAPARLESTPVRPAKPKGRLALGPLCMTARPSRFDLGSFGRQALEQPAVAEHPMPPAFLHASPIEPRTEAGVPSSLRTSVEQTVKGVAFLDRFYKMRPRAGVLSTDLPSMRYASAEPLVGPGAPASVVFGSNPQPQPAPVDRMFRMRPRAGVDTPTAPLLADAGQPETAKIGTAKPGLQTAERGVELPQVQRLYRGGLHSPLDVTTSGQVSIQSGSMYPEPRPEPPSVSVATSEYAPNSSDRFADSRLLKPVADLSVAGSCGTGTDAEPLSSPPAAPVLSLSGCEPVAVDRLFRMRPRAGVDAATVPLVAFGISASGAPSQQPVVVGRAMSSDAAPPLVDRAFRMRPRGGLDADTELFAASSSEPVTSTSAQPVVLQSAGATARVPVAVDRLFRMRPRSGVDSATQTSDGPPVSPAESTAVARQPQFTFAAPEPAVTLVDRMFRPRPKPVADASLAGHSSASGETEPMMSAPATPSLGVGTCEPAFLDRMYRIRPRAGVDRNDAAPIHGSSAPAGLVPSIERPTFAAQQQNLTIRQGALKASRPRSGVADASLAAAMDASGAAQPFQTKPTSPRIGVAGCEPLFVDRMFRMRPRTGVGQATTVAVMPPEIAADSLLSKPACPTNSAVPLDFAPRAMERLYRGKPRAGVPSTVVAEFVAAPPAPAPLASAAAVVTQSLPECAPPPIFRVFRFRPKSGVSSETAVLSTEVEPLNFPAGEPEHVPDWWDVLTGPKPLFVNRMYRMRFKQPAQDPDTLTHPIRTKQLPVPDPEPVLASLPTAASAAAPGFLNRLFRMRPKSGKDAAPAAAPIPCGAIEPHATSEAPASALQSFSKQWKATPMRIKSLAATVPAILFFALFPQGTPSQAAVDPVREAIIRRAAVEHTPDFVGGVTDWTGVERWKRTASGAVEPAGLGLFRPSMAMKDYKLEFAAQILKGSVGFVVRATDERNYQAVQLRTVKQGPLPRMTIVRWAVIDGKQTDKQEIPLPLNVTSETVYRIGLDVNGQSFTLMVQGKLVDSWSDERLETGGAGFFGGKSDQALIFNLRLSHQDDAIGKLFAALSL